MDRTPFIHILILAAFLVNTFGPLPTAMADEFRLPAPGVMVHLSPPLDPPILKGIKVHPDNPFRFDFILDRGDSQLTNDALKDESSKLVKYFLASLTVPEKDLWVNLSPYEKDRIVPNSFGQTEMGRDLLAEDYMLKQITASLIYPEDGVGRKFWKRIYEEAAKKFGTTDIPVNTFNKVWIVPEKAVVYENAQVGAAYVVESKLKVMLEQDYLALEKNQRRHGDMASTVSPSNALGSQMVREVVIPELIREVNEDKNFARLRQVYNSLILATWYKNKIKHSILSLVYTNRNKIAGVNIDDPQEKQKIYQRYLRAFKKGVYNYIKEDIDPATQESIPRKYFSGGVNFEGIGNTSFKNTAMTIATAAQAASAAEELEGSSRAMKVVVNTVQVSAPQATQAGPARSPLDAAMINPLIASRLALLGGHSFSHNARQNILDRLRMAIGEGHEHLLIDITTYLDAQEDATRTISYLPPNLAHVERVLENSNNLLNAKGEGWVKRLAEEFGVTEKQAKKIAIVATILLKIGFSDKDIRKNRDVAIEKIGHLEKDGLYEVLGLITDEQKGKFTDAIKRAGTYGEGPNYADLPPKARKEKRDEKYTKSLIAFLTLSSEIDISRDRLQDWQKSQVIMGGIFNALLNPEVREFYTERTKLEIELREPNQVRSVSEINHDIEINKIGFNAAVKGRIKSEIKDQESRLKEQMIKKEGYSRLKVNEIFEHLKNSIDSINSETYLWIISSYFIKEARINADGDVELDFYADQIPQLGAAVNLEHITRFHIDRLKPIIKEINEKQGLKDNPIKLIVHQLYENEGLYKAIYSMLKAETHAHTKMSVDFDFIWQIITGEELVARKRAVDLPKERAKFVEALEKSEILLTQMRKRAGLPEEKIGLVGLVDNIQWTLGHLEELMRRQEKYGTWEFKSKEDLVNEAREMLKKVQENGGKISMTANDQESLGKLIELYDRLKTEVRDIFNFRSGALTSFVFSFMATSGLFKASPGEEEEKLREIVIQMLKKSQDTNVAYTEQRFNIGDYNGTRGEILAFLQAYNKFKEQEEREHRPVPDLNLILSITKFNDKEKSPGAREEHKIASARVLIKLMSKVVENIKNGEMDEEFRDDGLPVGHGITNRMLLQAGLNLDAAGQEESNEPGLFFEAFREYYKALGLLNVELKEYYDLHPKEKKIYFNQRGTTFHVSESITDVSPETGMINTLRAIFMDNLGDENFDWDHAGPILGRVGHSIIPWLYDYDQFLGKEMTERVSERIKMVRTAIVLIGRGVPLFNPTMEKSNAPWSPEGMKNQLKAELEKLETMDPNDKVTYVYDKDRVQDLKTMAGFIRDVVIKNDIVTETNPTSNLGVSPYISGYDTHPVKQLREYRYGQWVKTNLVGRDGSYTYAGRPIDGETAKKLKNLEADEPARNRARFTINTDDLTLFGTDLNEEIYRIAIAQGLTSSEVADIVQEGFNSRFSQVPLTQAVEIRDQHIKATIDTPYETLEQMMDELPDAIIFKLEQGLTGLPEAQRNQVTAAAGELMGLVKHAYKDFMKGQNAEGNIIPEELLMENYHNHLHNLMVTFGALKLTENAGMHRNIHDIKVTFLAALLHDFQIRFVTLQGKGQKTPAFVAETLEQLKNLLFAGEQYEGKLFINNSAYPLSVEHDEDFKRKFRTAVKAFLGDEDLQEIWLEIKAMILRTDFASDVAAPAYTADTQAANEARQKGEEIIEMSKAGVDAVKQAKDSIKQVFEARISALEEIRQKDQPMDMGEREKFFGNIEKSVTWLNRRMSIELAFLEGLLEIQGAQRRLQVFQLAIRLEMADQSGAGWMGNEKVAEQITKGLAQELAFASLEGNYPFFYKPQLLNPKALNILKDLPLESKINFYRNMEYFADLSERFGGKKDWHGKKEGVAFKDLVLVSLGLYMDQKGKIHPLSSRTDIETMKVLLYSTFGKSLNLDQLHALATNPGVGIQELNNIPGSEYLFKEGDKVTDPDADDDVYLIINGKLDIVKEASRGVEEKFIVTRKQGDLIGEIGAVTGKPRTASVRINPSSSGVKLLHIPRSLFQGAFLANDQLRHDVVDLIDVRKVGTGAPGTSVNVDENRLKYVVMKLSFRKVGAEEGWEGSVLKQGVINPGSEEQIKQTMVDVLADLKRPDSARKFSGQVPDFKSIIITDSGRYISLYQDPTDGKLLLSLSYKFFEGGDQDEIKARLGWALYHQLLYLSADVKATRTRPERFMEEGILLLRDLLADQGNKEIEKAIGYLGYFIERSAGDINLVNSLTNLQKLYIAFQGQQNAEQKGINWEVVKALLHDVYGINPADLGYDRFMESFRRKLEARGVVSLVDRAMRLGVDDVTATGPKGGIDFNADKMNLEVKNNGGEIGFKIDPAQLSRLQNAPGFVPVIITIQPMTDIQGFLGLKG